METGIPCGLPDQKKYYKKGIAPAFQACGLPDRKKYYRKGIAPAFQACGLQPGDGQLKFEISRTILTKSEV